MKTKIILACSVITLMACDTLTDTLETANDVLGGGETGGGLTEAQVVDGLKEALNVGTNNSSAAASKEDGFWKNDRLRIPFPQDAIKVKDAAEDLGLSSQIEKFELTLNRAAEEACKEAAPIFINAITNMTIADGWNILQGDSNAATTYLKDNTSAGLYTAFKPKVATAIETVKLTSYWEPIITKYNNVMALTGGEQLNPDLEDYVTNKAIDGLFLLIADEEEKIRKDPVARVTDLLKEVFGSLD